MHSAYSEFRCSILFLFANFQYISTAIAYSISKPFRKNLFTNFPFLISILVSIGLSCYLLMYPCTFIARWMKLDIDDIDFWYRIVLLVAAVVNGIVVWVLERVFIVGLIAPAEQF